jgi:glutamine amidotransferase
MTATPRVTVIDYGMGNLASVMNMLKRIGASATLTSDVAAIENAERLILPGVGAFDHGVHQMNARGLFGLVQRKAAGGTPLLGLCLGMALLAGASEEGVERGLGLIEGESRRFSFPNPPVLPVPHVGWNEPTFIRASALTPETGSRPRYYFTHSYHLVCRNEADVIATADYGYPFPAIVSSGNVYGVQFHPEKSHRFGMELLRRFAEVPAASRC